MNEYKYILEPYNGMSTRYRCPQCKHREKTLSLYLDTETGSQLNPIVGRCNRESSCGYHYTPKQYYLENGILPDNYKHNSFNNYCSIPQQKQVSFIPIEIFKNSLKEYDQNNFIDYLISLFGFDISNELISKYFIATSKHWDCSTVFWQIDTLGKIRTGKIMLYNGVNGKRIKEPYNHIHWAHKLIKQPDFGLKQCLFGEHLLNDRSKPIAIVESEKTAIIASVYLPQFIWLAVGSLTNLNAERCNILKGRNVTLFPDLKGFDKWSRKAKELSHLANFKVSDLLERKATHNEKEIGLDLADYLVRFNYKSFNNISETKTTTVVLSKQIFIPAIEHEEKHTYPLVENWQIGELEQQLSKWVYPTVIHLSQCETINNVQIFIDSHLALVKANEGKRFAKPYLDRLNKILSLKTTLN